MVCIYTRKIYIAALHSTLLPLRGPLCSVADGSPEGRLRLEGLPVAERILFTRELSTRGFFGFSAFGEDRSGLYVQ